MALPALILAGAVLAAQQPGHESGEPAPPWGEMLRELHARLSGSHPDAARSALAELQDMLEALRAELDEEATPPPDALATFLEGALLLADAVGDPDASLAWLEAARSAAERIQAPVDRAEGGAKVAVTLAGFLIRRGELARARTVVETALRECAASRLYRPWLLLTSADLLRAAGAYDPALERLAQAEQALAASGAGPGPRADLLLLRAQLYSDLGLPDQAAASFEEARPLAESSSDPALQLSFLLLSSTLDLGTRRHERVLRELGARLAKPEFLAAEPGFRAQLEIRLGAAQAALEGKDPSREERAEGTLRAALRDPALPRDEQRIAETFLVGLFLRTHRLEEAREHLLLAEAHLAHERAHGSPGERALETALLCAYRSRLGAGAGADRERLAAEHERLRAACTALLEQRRTLPWRSGGIGILHFNDARFILGEFLSSAIRVAGEGPGCAEGLEMLMRFQELGSLARVLGARAGGLADLRALLASPEHGLLVYLPTAFGSHVLALDREHLLHEDLPSTDALDPAIQELSVLVARSPAALSRSDRAREERDLERVRKALASMLFPGRVRGLLERWRAVTIAGEDLLEGLPFECLPVPSARSSLGLERALDHLPSLPVGLHLARRSAEAPAARARSLELWLVAAPAASEGLALGRPGLPELSFSERDQERLTSPYRPGAVRVFRGPRATRACLEAGELRGAGVLHLLVHGLADLERERPAGLMLAPASVDDGLLWCEDFERLPLPPLVVLSACGAARGPVRRGEDGLTNLGGAALYAGAHSVILSRGELELQATLQLMETFHVRLRAGDSPAEALRSARAALSASERWAHPFYHALLKVIGLGQEPVFR